MYCFRIYVLSVYNLFLSRDGLATLTALTLNSIFSVEIVIEFRFSIRRVYRKTELGYRSVYTVQFSLIC